MRGNTQRALVRMLREAGAVEVHVRIASPPVKWPCFYGIDFATPAELIANAPGTQTGDGEMLEAVRQAIGADTWAVEAGHDRGHRTARQPAMLRLLRR